MSKDVCPVASVGSSGACGFAVFGTFPPPTRLVPCHQSTQEVYEQEHKTLTDLLTTATSSEPTGYLQNVETNFTDEEVLAVALGAPARRVVTRAELSGPSTGWRDGHLSAAYGFCPPDPSTSPSALDASPGKHLSLHSHCLGKVWSDLCILLPDIVSQGKAREAISTLPSVDAKAIPDAALWAAVVCLGILAHTYRYEEKYDGHEGGSMVPLILTSRNYTQQLQTQRQGFIRARRSRDQGNPFRI